MNSLEAALLEIQTWPIDGIPRVNIVVDVHTMPAKEQERLRHHFKDESRYQLFNTSNPNDFGAAVIWSSHPILASNLDR